MKKVQVACCLVALLALTACSRTEPVKNIQESVSAQYSDATLKRAILEAGQARQWIMQPVGPGVIEGHLIQRTHRANIRITYGTGHYAIQYVNSENLLAKNGDIHRNYNRWVTNLDRDIQLRLASQDSHSR